MAHPELTDVEWLSRRARSMTAQAIADEIGCSQSTVRRALRKHGLRTINRGRPARFPELHDRDWLARRLGQGRTSEQIADELGCATITVAKARVTLGLSSRLPRYPELQDLEWLEQHQHLRDREVADLLGCSASGVRVARERHGIPPYRYNGRLLREPSALSTTAQRTAWLAMYLERRGRKRMPAEEVAALLGIDERTAYRYLATIDSIYQETE